MKSSRFAEHPKFPRIGLTQLRRQFRIVAKLIDRAGGVLITERGIPISTMRRVRSRKKP